MSRAMERRLPAGSIVALILLLILPSCAIRKVETSKDLYDHAMKAAEDGKDLQAIVYWKELVKRSDAEIAAGHYLPTNYFLRATAHIELGEWDAGFEDLKSVQIDSLRKEEYWIYPLCLVLLGDYYSRNSMTSVAQNFYQAILKKSAYKSTSIYLLALERQINNSIKAIQIQAEKEADPEKYKRKEYESLAKDVEKYIEEAPFSSVPHFLLADLLMKTGQPEPALEHLIASIEFGLPTKDLQKSAEFEIAELLTRQQIALPLRAVLVKKAAGWWGTEGSSSIFIAGEETIESLQARFELPNDSLLPAKDAKIKYLAITGSGRPRIVAWDK